MTRSERLQVTPVKDGPLPKSRVAEATLATLQMAPLKMGVRILLLSLKVIKFAI